jgi:hypothetical protein
MSIASIDLETDSYTTYKRKKSFKNNLRKELLEF